MVEIGLRLRKDDMPKECVFYLHGYRQHCEVTKALGYGPAKRGEDEGLRNSFCSTSKFMDCPRFKKLERSLAKSNLRLEMLSAA
jgi:hypothetical protein